MPLASAWTGRGAGNLTAGAGARRAGSGAVGPGRLCSAACGAGISASQRVSTTGSGSTPPVTIRLITQHSASASSDRKNNRLSITHTSPTQCIDYTGRLTGCK
ncbi:MAG: hypothetical protein ACOX63_09375 [Christensenellales bacterium]